MIFVYISSYYMNKTNMANINRKVSHSLKKRKPNNERCMERSEKRRRSCQSEDEWNSCKEGFDGLKCQAQSSTRLNEVMRQTQEKIEWASEPEEEVTDSLPHSTQDQLDIVDESPVKSTPAMPAMSTNQSIKSALKTKHHQKARHRHLASLRNSNNNNNNNIEFPDDIESFTKETNQEQISKEVSLEEKQRKRLHLSEDIFSQRSSGKNTQNQDASIAEYESESDESSPSVQKSRSEDEDESDVVISQPVSSMDSAPSSPPYGPPRIKVTEWVNNLQTPLKQQPPQQNHESAKKKHKFEKDSLAERMQKLVSRERVSYTMWKHRVNSARKQEGGGGGGCLTVEIVSHSRCFSHLCAECIPCPDTELPSSLDNAQSLRLLLLADTMGTINVGDRIKIHPPWQKMVLADGTISLLCTQHCQLLERDKDGRCKEKQGGWSCPCSKDCSLAPVLCPYYAHPYSAETSRLNTTAADISLPPGLCSPSASPPCCPDVRAQTSPIRTILHAIEGQGHSGLSFTATVVRRYTKKAHKNSTTSSSQAVKWRGGGRGETSSVDSPSSISPIQRSILLQDSSNTLCVLHIPDIPQWEEIFADLCIGQTVEWSGLRVTQRVTNTRSAALFSMLEAVREEQGNHEALVSAAPVGFCYILSASPGESSCNVAPSPPHPPLSHQPTLLSLAEIHNPQRHRRASFRCSVEARLYHCEFSGDKAGGESSTLSHLYLIDQSIQCPNKVIVCPGVYIHPEILQKLQDREGFTLRELWFKHGELYMDEFSQVDVSDALWEVGHIEPPRLCSNKPVNSIVTVQGKIYDVDEETAFSWLACDRCHNDKLVEGGTPSNPFLFCRRCCKSVVNPISRMHLEVFIKMQTTAAEETIQLKLKLEQKSIEYLLAEQTEEQGYEISCILEKSLGPLPCIITSERKAVIEAKEIQPLY